MGIAFKKEPQGLVLPVLCVGYPDPWSGPDRGHVGSTAAASFNKERLAGRQIYAVHRTINVEGLGQPGRTAAQVQVTPDRAAIL